MKRSKLPEAQPPGWDYYIKKLALTFVLVGVLGVVFYLLVMGVSNAWADAGVQYWLTLILILPSIWLTCRYAIEGIRDGEFPVRFSTVSRRYNPLGYWITLAITTLALIAMCLLVLFAVRALL